MQKNNVKSFICSFMFSVLGVIAVQKVFFRAPEIKKTEDISAVEVKNISLFADKSVEKDDFSALRAEQTANIDVSEIAALSAPEKIDLPALEEKPAQAHIVKVQPVVTEQPIETVQKADTITDLAYASEITLDPEEIKEINETQKHINSGIIYADISDTLSEIPSDEKDQDKNLVIASASETFEEIPLSENDTLLHNKIDVSNEEVQSKIAMIEPNTLINSIEQDDILSEEKNLAEANIKNSELSEMFDISQTNSEPEVDESAWQTAKAASAEDFEESTDVAQNQEDKDSPWVMAKGNKYAKNHAVVEEFEQKEHTLNQKENISSEPAISEQATPEDKTEETKEHQEQLQEENTDEKSSLGEEVSLFDSKDEEDTFKQTLSEPLLKQKKTDTKLAYQMIQNILIPIPQDILNDADLTPDLTSSPEEKELSGNVRVKKPDLNNEEKQTGLFKSISSWFSKDKNQRDDEASKSNEAASNGQASDSSSLKQKVYSALGMVDDYKPIPAGSIMPAELRLSFQPNRAEISGQTLKWIYAFADNARDNNDVYIEVRIDGTSSYVLQQKRLNLLSSIFSARGVDWRKINTIFTSREPNSFIIRNIRFNNKEKEGQNMK